MIKCLGATPATGMFAASLGGERLAGNGALAVEPTLQVKGWPNVFAAGDCTDVKEEKTAALAGMSGEGSLLHEARRRCPSLLHAMAEAPSPSPG